MCCNAQNKILNDIRRIIEEFEHEEGDGIIDFAEDLVDDPNNIDYELEEIKTGDHDSKSEEKMERANEENVETEQEKCRFFIGKIRTNFVSE